MTVEENGGWSEEYRDPRDRPHPAVLRITVEPFAECVQRTVAAVEAVERDEPQPAVVSLGSVEELRAVLTDRRVELLQCLLGTDEPVASISALADTLERDYRTVHDDVSLLADLGVLFVIDEAGVRRPFLPYERIDLDVTIDGGRPPSERQMRRLR